MTLSEVIELVSNKQGLDPAQPSWSGQEQVVVPKQGPSRWSPASQRKTSSFCLTFCIALVSKASAFTTCPYWPLNFMWWGRGSQLWSILVEERNISVESAWEMSEKTLVFVCIRHWKKEPVSKHIPHFLLPWVTEQVYYSCVHSPNTWPGAKIQRRSTVEWSH